MKALLVIVIAVAAGLVVYNYATTGRFSLVPASLKSTGERQLERLEDRFTAAKSRYEQAGRAVAISGIDASADAEAARREVERVEGEVKDLRERLSEAQKTRADRLLDKIQSYEKEMR